MRVILLLSTMVAISSAFTTTTSPFYSRNGASLLRMSTAEETSEEVPVLINGRNIDLTPAIVDYVNKRIGGPINKLSSNGAIRECDVHLSVSKNPKVKNGHRVEITTNMIGTTFHVTTESPDMYAALDAAGHALNRKLCKYKERRMDGWHGGEKMGDDLLAALESFEEEASANEVENTEDDEFFTDPEAPTITKVKSFDLENSISIDEAIFALDYIDHDFYVFRNKETDQINVVYKRNVGGVGHIEP